MLFTSVPNTHFCIRRCHDYSFSSQKKKKNENKIGALQRRSLATAKDFNSQKEKMQRIFFLIQIGS